jgi:pyridoxamine 5'-phosphate oxidase family protein
MVRRRPRVVVSMAFTEHEVAYLRSQLLGRLATVARDGQPDNAAVGFRLEDDGTILIGGMNVTGTRKWRNVAAGNERVAFVVDDLASTKPWRPRGVRVYGRAELVETEGQFGPGSYLKIRPSVSWSWGIEPGSVEGRFRPHRIEHDASRRSV